MLGRMACLIERAQWSQLRNSILSSSKVIRRPFSRKGHVFLQKSNDASDAASGGRHGCLPPSTT